MENYLTLETQKARVCTSSFLVPGRTWRSQLNATTTSLDFEYNSIISRNYAPGKYRGLVKSSI